jgi:hypothetical protein
MSISFSAPDLQPTYQAIIDGSAHYDWALFNQTGNELKVQATGNGLEELEDEFMDGRSVMSSTGTTDTLILPEYNTHSRGSRTHRAPWTDMSRYHGVARVYPSRARAYFVSLTSKVDQRRLQTR